MGRGSGIRLVGPNYVNLQPGQIRIGFVGLKNFKFVEQGSGKSFYIGVYINMVHVYVP